MITIISLINECASILENYIYGSEKLHSGGKIVPNSREAPPPGAYDPKFDQKIKGYIIEKTERFQDNKSVISNGTDSSLTVSSKSTGNQPQDRFLTPQCPRRSVIVKSINPNYPQEKLKSMNQTKNKTINKRHYNYADQLLELQVECTNKDKTIQEHEKHIEEIKEEMCKLEVQIEDLHKKQVEVEEQHRKDIETMAKLQQEVLDNHDERHQAEADELRSKLLDMSREKEQEISARRTLENELRKRVAELLEKISFLENELSKITETNRIAIQTLETRNKELLSKLKTLEEERDIQIELLEKERSQLLLNISDLTDNKCDLENKLGKRQDVILELQGQLSTLQCELDELRAEYDKLLDDSMRQMNDLVKNYNVEKDTLKDTFVKEKKELQLQYDQTKMTVIVLQANLDDMADNNSFLQQELQDVQRLYRDVSQRLTQAHEELEIAEQKHEFVLKEHKNEIEALQKQHSEEKSELKQLLEEAKEDYLNEIENLSIARDKEIAELQKATSQTIEEETKRIKEHTNKIVENAEAVTRETIAVCRAESEERVKRVIAECDAKINTMIREATAAIEEEMRLNIEKYKACLKRVETERAALDDKLAQRDAEITKLSSILEELKSTAETRESFSQSLQVGLDRAETELAEKKAELRALKNQIRAEAAEMVARRKRFEIVMAENQASVAALSKRLAQSHAEVERLQDELKRGEDCIHEHRDLLASMRNNSQMVHDQVHNIMKQLDAERQLVSQIEAGSLSEFESIKTVFEMKIDELQRVAAKEITRLREEINKKSSESAEMKRQLDEMAGSLCAAEDMLLRLEERNDAQMIEISRLEVESGKLHEQLNNQKKISEETTALMSVQSVQHKLAIEKANYQLKELSMKVISLEERERCAENKHILAEKEKEQWHAREEKLLKELAEERARRETAETEVKTLTDSNDRLQKEYEDINEKYAEIVGHQNHKQRIKHVSQLKEKIYRLEQELQTKSRQLEHQQKAGEKLKAQQKRPHTKGKENVIGVTRSSHTTPTSSPHKSLTPLRNRNE
ncbi:hyaluronan mediated motility receptor-like isoform X2 [Vespa velutina]|uniref:hyaluronan mediated motility receptor-like isoform X2 n=1 Tax=Vespa velutina TaxID=202808 RepID=UPI001FB25F69|nr:hyaluronan mediated motility receptor-like isoform X2 [Vespa velutina]